MTWKLVAAAVFAVLVPALLSPAYAWVSLRPPHAIVKEDWQSPEFLPRRFRNHCAFDAARGRFYCANHCAFDYQFYYCSRESFGCCRVGFGYCDWRGLLRCAP